MGKKLTYYPEGGCSVRSGLERDGDIIKDVAFTGGCNGNLNAISKLIKGMKAEDVIDKLEGNRCGVSETSCADQMCKGLRQALAES